MDGEFGVILDFTKDAHYTVNELEDFVDAVQQDFYCSMTFYQTESISLDSSIMNFFSEEFELYKKYFNRHLLVMQQQDLLLQTLIEKVDEVGFENFKEKISLVSDDQHEVVKCYLENNFNLSLGAKVLHMHRNTFMNKLERFIQSTGLNVKEFRDAMIAYLIIEKLETESKM
jgi:DNA-binding PucR family transcriptional regulator